MIGSGLIDKPGKKAERPLVNNLGRKNRGVQGVN